MTANDAKKLFREGELAARKDKRCPEAYKTEANRAKFDWWLMGWEYGRRMIDPVDTRAWRLVNARGAVGVAQRYLEIILKDKPAGLRFSFLKVEEELKRALDILHELSGTPRSKEPK